MARLMMLVLFLCLVGCGASSEPSRPEQQPEMEVVEDDSEDEDDQARAPRERRPREAAPEPSMEPESPEEPEPEPPTEEPEEPAEPEPSMVPSNATNFGTFESTGIVAGPPNGVFDTDTGCTLDSVMGECRPIDGDLATPSFCVCRVDELTIGNVTLEGSRGLVLLASRSLRVTGTFDISAVRQTSGPGSYVTSELTAGRNGGSGGSFGSYGGRSAAAPYGTEDLQPLVGGTMGQDTCGLAGGGGGGGAVQLSAAVSVSIEGTILANGGGGSGGRSGDSCNGGAGGGSGGAVLIEAPQVEVTGLISANGGGGGSGGTTDYSGSGGSDGMGGTTAAPGGSSVSDTPCLLYSDVYSGYGGAGAVADTPATDGGYGESETRCIGNTYSGDGGGGGGVGRIRINTLRGPQNCLCNGTMSPMATFGDVAFE